MIYFRLILSAFCLLLTITCCKGFVTVDGNDKKKNNAFNAATPTPSSASTSLYAPTAHALASDVSLVATSAADTSAPLAPTAAYAITNGILVPAGAPAVGGPLFAAITSGPTAASGTGTTSSALLTPAVATTLDSVTPFTATITATATFPSSVPSSQQLCATDSPFSSLSCVIGSFSFASSAFTTNYLTSVARAGNGGASDKINSSNSLTVKKFKVKQLSNINIAGEQAMAAWTHNGRLFFQAMTGATSKLYSTNGLDLAQVTDTRPGTLDTMGAAAYTSFNNATYFPSFVGGLSRNKLFKFDGTTLTQLTDLFVGGNDGLTNIYACGNYLYFTASPGAATNHLYSYDGTAIRQITSMLANDSIWSSSSGCLDNGTLIFAAFNGSSRRKVYSTNGTNLVQIGNLNGAGTHDFVGGIFTYKNRFYFYGNDAGGFEKLYSTDGTDYVQVTNLFAGNEGYSTKSTSFVICDNVFYFAANINATDAKYFSFDGSTLKQISNTNTAGTDFSAGSGSRCVKNKLIIGALDSAGNSKLYQYNGTILQKLLDIRPGNNDNITYSSVVGTGSLDFLFFGAYDASGISQFYSYDGSIITQLTSYSIATGFCWNFATTALSGRYFTFCKSNSNKYKLYSTNGYDFVKHTEINGSGTDDYDFGINIFDPLSSGILPFSGTSAGVSRVFTICTDDTTGC